MCACATTHDHPTSAQAPVAPAPGSKVYAVTGMTCGHCVASITAEVSKIASVSAVSVDLAGGTVTVTGTHIDDRAVRAAVDAAGYAVA